MFRATLMVFIQKTSPVTTTLIPYGSMFRCHCMANLYNKSWICKTYVRAILSGVRSHLFYSLMALLHVLQPFVQTQKCQKRHRLKDGEVGGVIKREMGNSFGNLRKYEPLERFSPSAVLWEALQHQLFSSSMCARAPRMELIRHAVTQHPPPGVLIQHRNRESGKSKLWTSNPDGSVELPLENTGRSSQLYWLLVSTPSGCWIQLWSLLAVLLWASFPMSLSLSLLTSNVKMTPLLIAGTESAQN